MRPGGTAWQARKPAETEVEAAADRYLFLHHMGLILRQTSRSSRCT